MPVGALKNTLYGIALPVLGKRCEWRRMSEKNEALTRALRRRHVIGACVQRFEKGKLTQVYAAGYAALEPEKSKVTPQTLFRTASIAKMASAMLVFRLQTLGSLSVKEDISDFLGYRVRNPYCPDAPITLGMLLSHTSGIVDSPAYFASFHQPRALEALLKDEAAFHPSIPGAEFRYSNLAAGMVASLLEKRFNISFEALIQRELLIPLGIRATYDLTKLDIERTADSYRVLPPARAFDAKMRWRTAVPMDAPDPEHRYLPAAGGLFLTATELAKLALAAWNGENGFLNEEALTQMRTPIAGWPDQAVHMRHGMGLLVLEDEKVCSRTLWGHQGFAYGAVNGVFFDGQGSGFAMLNSGASEQRVGHLALLNRDLISLLTDEEGGEEA